MLEHMNTFQRHLIPFVAAAAAGIALPATAYACPPPPKFVTPSGNIWCLVPNGFDGSNGVVCEIQGPHLQSAGQAGGLPPGLGRPRQPETG